MRWLPKVASPIFALAVMVVSLAFAGAVTLKEKSFFSPIFASAISALSRVAESCVANFRAGGDGGLAGFRRRSDAEGKKFFLADLRQLESLRDGGDFPIGGGGSLVGAGGIGAVGGEFDFHLARGTGCEKIYLGNKIQTHRRNHVEAATGFKFRRGSVGLQWLLSNGPRLNAGFKDLFEGKH